MLQSSLLSLVRKELRHFRINVQEKMDLYKEYLAYITGYLGANEEILLKLDKLLLEISQCRQHIL